MPSLSQRPALGLWLLLAVAFVCLSPGIWGDYLWDDNVLIRDNENAHHLSQLRTALTTDFWTTTDVGHGFQSGYYRPVVTASFVVLYALGGGSPVAFHLANVLLHLLCIALAYLFLMRRLESLAPERTPRAMAVALALIPFALHPSRPESVTWIVGSTDLWMAFFALLGACLWQRGRAVASAVFFALAVLSKETALLFPLALVLDAALSADARKESLKRLLPTGVALVAVVVLRGIYMPLRYSSMWSEGVGRLFARVGCSLLLYLGEVVWPWPASVQAGALPLDAEGGFILPTALTVAGVVVGISAFGVALALTRVPRARPWLADLAYFIVPLLPVLNAVPMKYNVLISERFLYLPLLGISALLARLIVLKLKDFRRVILLASAGLAVAYAVTTSLHAAHFESDLTLWEYESALDPHNPYVADLLARSLWTDERPAEALAAVTRAMEGAYTEDDRAKSAVLWASIRNSTLTDADQTELTSLRAFFDAFADLRRDAVPLRLDGQRELTLRPLSHAREKLLRSKTFALDRAIAHARTMDLLEAERLFRAELQRSPQRLSVLRNLIRILMLEQKWDEALTLIASSAQALEADERHALTAEVTQARAKLSTLPSAEPARATELARVFLLLRSPALARKALQELPPNTVSEPEAVRAAVSIELFEGRFDAATSLLEAARRARPGASAEWDELAQRINRERAALQRSDT